MKIWSNTALKYKHIISKAVLYNYLNYTLRTICENQIGIKNLPKIFESREAADIMG